MLEGWREQRRQLSLGESAYRICAPERRCVNMDHEILILRTGEPPRQVKERYGSYDQAIINALGGERKFVVVDARREPLPKPACGAIIITGSAASAYNGDEWIRQSEDFLRQAADRGIAI